MMKKKEFEAKKFEFEVGDEVSLMVDFEEDVEFVFNF